MYAQAALDALHLSANGSGSLCGLTDTDWEALLDFCDRTQLTLAFAQRCGERPPEWAKRRLERSLAQSAVRWSRIKSAFEECASAFAAAKIPFTVLKGFSHCPEFIPDPRLRTQFDLDLFFSPEDIMKAYDVAVSLGFEPLGGFDRFPLDHLPTMVRKTGWEWRGDFFDTEIPVSLELHFRLWDERTERFAVDGLEDFWERRRPRELEGIHFVGLHTADTVGYACLHIMRHLLRGALRPSHVYELALFLDRKCDDASFWEMWGKMHAQSLQRVEVIAFGLASCWFGCRLAPHIRASMDSLPIEIQRWLIVHGESPLIGLFRPNKDDLWLHWNLVNSTTARLAIVRRKMLPQRFPGSVRGIYIPDAEITWKVKWAQRFADLRFFLSRSRWHVLAVIPTALSAFRWWFKRWDYR
jgi:hypothetical protein